MDTSTLVALIGFGTAAVGLLAAVLGRKKVIVHRHVYDDDETERGSSPLRWIGIVILVLGLGVGVAMGTYHFLKAPGTANQSAAKTDNPPDVKTDLAEYQKQNLRAKGPAYIQKTGPKRIDFWRQTAEKGSAEGQFLFGRCLLEGAGIAKNDVEGVVWLRKAVAQGFAPAQHSLGECYYFGHGVGQDFAESVRWFRMAADQGEAGAQVSLGNCYRNGSGIAKDLAESLRWYRKGAAQGEVWSQYMLGYCYAAGDGVARDLKEAIRWFRPAAEQGLRDAQYYVASSYRDAWEGEDKRDFRAALLWYHKAADQDYMLAQYMLGIMYAGGEGKAKDPVKAVDWYRKAAEQGYDWAQFYLGKCYEQGQGATKDLAAAEHWYGKASAQGNADAKKALETLVNVSLLKDWTVISGRWKVDGTLVTYLGPDDPKSTTPHGLILSKANCRKGVIETKTRFLGNPKNDAAYLVLGYDKNTTEYYLIGLQGHLAEQTGMYRFSEFHKTQGWNPLDWSTDKSVPKAQLEYRLRSAVDDSKVRLTVNEVQVLEKAFPRSMVGDQVGLFAWGAGPVEFKETRVSVPKP